jgi:hypothetical protein
MSYNPNTALIRGAAAVGMSMMPDDLSALDKITEQGISMMEQAKKEKKELNDMLDKAANKVLAKSGGLGEEMYNYALNKVQGFKEDYLKGQKIGGREGDKIKRTAMNNMAQWANFSSEHQQLNLVSAQNILQGNMVKNLTKDEQTILSNMHDEKFTVSDNAEGIMVYNMDVNGKNMQVTYDDYQKLAARVKNPKLANAFIKAKNVFEKNEDFNRDEFKHIIKQDISNKEQSFVDGLYEDFMGQTFYKALLDDKSIANEAMIAIANADPNDKITLEAIKNPGEIKTDIIAAITDPENPAFNLERSMDIMADKLTDMAEKSHKKTWDKIAQKEQAAYNKQLALRRQQDKERETLTANYGGGYVETSKLKIFVKDIENKEPYITGPDGSQYKFDPKINAYRETYNNKDGALTTPIPISNKKMLKRAEAWQHGMRVEEFEGGAFGKTVSPKDKTNALNLGNKKADQNLMGPVTTSDVRTGTGQVVSDSLD